MEEKYLDKDKTYPDKEASLFKKDIVSKNLNYNVFFVYVR